MGLCILCVGGMGGVGWGEPGPAFWAAGLAKVPSHKSRHPYCLAWLTEAAGPLMSQDSGLKSSWLWLFLAYLGQMDTSVHAYRPAGDKAVHDQMLRPSFGLTLPCW